MQLVNIASVRVHMSLTAMDDCRAALEAGIASPLSNGHVSQSECDGDTGKLHFEISEM